MNKMSTNFLSLDLELNNAADGSTSNPKIIAVGICIGNAMQSEEEYTIKNWYINPHEPIFPEITKLTGITDEVVQHQGCTHEEIAYELQSLIYKYRPFINPVTWGGGDSLELIQEFNDRNIKFPHFGRRWIDVKTFCTFLSISTNRSTSGGLSSIMGRYKLQFKGKAHRADVDAFNTLRFFFHLIERQKTFENVKTILNGVS